MKIWRILSLVLIVFFSSCSEYNKVQKGRDMDAKFDLAIKLYNKGQYFKALPLLEELITVFRGTKKAENTYYYYAYTMYRIGDYESASFDFDNFVKTYPNSEFTEECAFMKAYCFYQASPKYSLDQTNTYKAINELQLFLDRYPSSSRLQECNQLIDQLHSKLELKAYENAQLYYNMDDYKAAIASFRILLNDFPASVYREEALYKIVRSSFLYAENSIEDKKYERYNQTLLAYIEFSNAYPESKFKSKALDIYQDAQRRMDKLSNKLVEQ